MALPVAVSVSLKSYCCWHGKIVGRQKLLFVMFYGLPQAMLKNWSIFELELRKMDPKVLFES